MNSISQEERRRVWASFQSGLQGLLVYSANQWPEETNRPAGSSAEALVVQPSIEMAPASDERGVGLASERPDGEFF